MISSQSLAFLEDLFLAPARPQDSPVIHATCGIPGAGKSTFVDRERAAGNFPKDAFLFNPDRIMQVLPEFLAEKDRSNAQRAYEQWELPCRKLAHRMAEAAITGNAHIIKDMGCARPENLDMLRRLKQKGYAVYMYHIKCDIGIAHAACP